jgi:hypothetical protein
MPISGPVHAINFQSIKPRLFERSEKIFASLVRHGVLGIGDRCACIGSAQRRSAFCVRMVRDTPQACIHPINAIKFLIE